MSTMKKLCAILAVLLTVALWVPALAEEAPAGDWIHSDNSEYRLLFDGKNMFYYDTDESWYYGVFASQGNGEYRLIDDMGDERTMTFDGKFVKMEGLAGRFSRGYMDQLMNYPNTDEGVWLNEDGETMLLFDLGGEFEYEDEDVYLYGECVYEDGSYLLTDDEGNTHTVILNGDGSLRMSGVDGSFHLEADSDGEDPFEDVKEDWEMFADWLGDASGAPAGGTGAVAAEGEEIPLSGKWYKYGDDSTIPFVLEGDSYTCEHSVFGYETSGTWEMDEIALSLTDEETGANAYIRMEDDDGISGGWDPIPMAGNKLLYADTQGVYFLHESLVGTDEGEQLCQMADFMGTTWWVGVDNTTVYLEFSCMDNAVICTSVDDDGESYSEIVGYWALEDGCIVAEYVTDEVGTYELPAESIWADGVEFGK